MYPSGPLHRDQANIGFYQNDDRFQAQRDHQPDINTKFRQRFLLYIYAKYLRCDFAFRENTEKFTPISVGIAPKGIGFPVCAEYFCIRFSITQYTSCFQRSHCITSNSLFIKFLVSLHGKLKVWLKHFAQVLHKMNFLPNTQNRFLINLRRLRKALNPYMIKNKELI